MRFPFPPPVVLLLAGAAAGPQGLGLLSPRILEFLDPAVPVALAVIGVAAGLAAPRTRAALAPAAAQSAIAGAIVAIGFLFARPASAVVDALPPWWIVALVLAVSSATSAPLPDIDGTTFDTDSLERHDYLLPVVAGGVLLALLREPSSARALSLTAQSSGIAITIAAAGWLLISRATAPSEQRVFVFACILLLGGIADALALSPMFAGLAAGLLWQRIGGAVHAAIARDIAYIEPSLLVLVLVLAGARATFSSATLLLAAAYVTVRTLAKISSGRLSDWTLPTAGRHTTAAALISPGIFGVAFALSAVGAAGEPLAPLLGVVMIGSIASALVALATEVKERPA